MVALFRKLNLLNAKTDEEFVQQIKDHQVMLRRSRKFTVVISSLILTMCVAFSAGISYVMSELAGPRMGGVGVAMALLGSIFGMMIGFKAAHATLQIIDALRSSRTEELMLRYHDALQEIQQLQESQTPR